MTKKDTKKASADYKMPSTEEMKKVTQTDLTANLPADMPLVAKKRLEKIKVHIEKFQKNVLAKFDDYVMGIALLPPSSPDEIQKKQEKKLTKEEIEKISNQINLLVLVDDTDSKKMSKEELSEKLSGVFFKIAKDACSDLVPQTVLLSELWQSSYDAKYDLNQLIASAAPVYDKGMLAAIKIAEVHKSMVLKKFEKYIVSYVLAGSLVQGRATPQSDIDVFVVIDDTDVKKMTRAELKDKLRAIIISMGFEAGKLTGIENKLNIQVYILTDFWDNIKEANPIIFTFLRDGIPFYDRGIFMPWKQLLRMGRIKPSPEAIDMFMNSGEQVVDRIKGKLRDIGVEDFFWATITPSQAALMLYGLPPPTPKETPELLRELFVKKEKIFEDEYVKIIEKILKIRKSIEHGTKKHISGAEVDELLEGSEKYLKRLKKLFDEIEALKERESVAQGYDSVVTIARDVLRFEGVSKVKDTQILKEFETHIIDKGVLPANVLSMLKKVFDAKAAYDKNKLTKAEVHVAKKEVRELIKVFVEHVQRKRGREIERTKIRVKHGDRFGEVILLGAIAFIIHDIDNEQQEISKAEIHDDGSLGTPESSSLEEMEKYLADFDIPSKAFIKQPIFENLKDLFGRDVEILIDY